MTDRQYPYDEGDYRVLGPEVFTDANGDVISWKGENYARQGDERRHLPTRRRGDRHLLWTMAAIGAAFLVVATVCSIVALKNSHDIAYNTKRDTYARDVATWHATLNNCRSGSRIIRAYLLDKRRDAIIVGTHSTSPEVRRYFAHQVKPLSRRARHWDPRRCARETPKPHPVDGVPVLP